VDVGELEERVRQLADLEEIRALKVRYCHLSDRGFTGAGDDPERVAELFTEDGDWGDCHGRDAIRALFEGFRTALPFAFHVALNPEIELDGERARGRWRGMIDLTAADGRSSRVLGIYNDDLRRTEQGWRFSRISFSSARRLRTAATDESA
jgi:hypothetical protein